jgi:hypothetical protein
MTANERSFSPLADSSDAGWHSGHSKLDLPAAGNAAQAAVHGPAGRPLDPAQAQVGAAADAAQELRGRIGWY